MRSIALITPNTDTFSNPTLLLLVRKLIELDYKILFFGHKQIFIPEEIKGKLELHSLPFNFISFFGRPKPLRRTLDFFKLIKQYIEVYKLFRVKNNVKSLVCIDPMGIVFGGRIKKIIDVKLIYVSFEIFFEDEIGNPEKKKVKSLEKEYSGRSDLIVIQDEERESLLRSENDLGKEIKFIHIPVSSEKIKTINKKFNLHKEFNIPESKTIVVYSGSLQSWSGIMKILDLFPGQWDNDNWLVIHTHNDLPENNETKQRINKLIGEKQNISFHNKAFNDFTEYAGFLSGCHIGIAVYFPNYEDLFSGKNVEEIGLSSGKFSAYIMLGKPSITTSNKIYKYLNEKYNFGYIIDSAEELNKGIRNINKEYEIKSAGCDKLFREVLDPEPGIKNLITQLNSYYA